MKKSALNIVVAFLLFLFLQSCSSSDVSTTPDQNPTTFQAPKTENIVMYEINPVAFSSSKDIQGITNKLDYLKDLGINTIWIMPIYSVGIVNSFGSFYCVKDYKSVRTSLGTMDDFKNLVATAHQKGIAVILDWVANHTSWDNNWIYSNPSWYTHDSNGNIIHPSETNWSDVADLNFDNSAMRLAMIDAMKYWVTETNIDGFRCDAADFIPYDFWVQANTSLNAIPNKHLILLAEGARADHFAAGFQLNFSWEYLNTLKSVFGSNQQNANSIFSSSNNEYSVVPTGKKKLRFITNHDESYLATPNTIYGGNDGAIVAYVITMCLQGVPLLYCGQEVGVSSTSIYNGVNTIDFNSNPEILTIYKKLLSFYNSSETIKKGITINYNDNNVVVFQKELNSEKILVIANTRSGSQNFIVPNQIQGNWTNALTNESVSLSGNLSLTGFQYLILKR